MIALRRFFSFAAGIVLLLAVAAPVSCSKNEESTPDGKEPEEEPAVPEEPDEPGVVVFNALLGEKFTTKATIDNLNPLWQEGDRINLFDSETTGSEVTLENINGNAASFSGTVAAKGPYVAVYPYSQKNTYSEGLLHLEVPSVQKTGGSAIAPGALVSVAYAEKASKGKCDLSFLNVCALVHITVSDESITGVSVFASDGTPVAGKVAVNPSTGAVSSIEEGADCVTLLPEGETLSPGEYYIAVLPGQVEGLKVLFSRKGDVRKGAWSAEYAVDFKRAQAINMGDSDELEWAYYISNADDLLAWCDDKANWNPEGEVITFTGDVNLKDAEWTPIADTYPGLIEGNGHKISHFHVSSASLRVAGFFATKYKKSVNNLIFGSEDGVNYDGTSYITNNYNGTSEAWTYAALFPYPQCSISNVTNFVPITISKDCTMKSRSGGICAWIEECDVVLENCHNYGPVTVENNKNTFKAWDTSGGIIGGISGVAVVVRNCVNHADVISRNIYTRCMGGIVGMNYSFSPSVLVENCVNEGKIQLAYSATHKDQTSIGGIYGKSICTTDSTPVLIRACTNRGEVINSAVYSNFTGGIVGKMDGATVDGCINEGNVTVDHTDHPTTRFQIAGGIAGAAGQAAGYGENSIVNNINRGNVTMLVASSGHTATPSSSTTFYGVNAGGILGLACEIKNLLYNSNYGNVAISNSFNATNASYPATASAGGVLGTDKNEIINFADNTSEGTVSAKTTSASSAASWAYAGGMAGYLQYSMMSSGDARASVSAQTEAAGGTPFAGSVAGRNDGSILACSYGGTVNGAAADSENMVGTGNKPLQSSEVVSGVFSVSKTEVDFPGTGYAAVSVNVTTGAENVEVTKQDLDWLTCEVPAEIPSGKGLVLQMTPSSGNVFQNRSGSLIFREKESGETKTISISQANLYTPVNGFPARWEISSTAFANGTSANDAGNKWIREGVASTIRTAFSYAPATEPGTGYISGVPVAGHNLKYSIDASSSTKTLCIGNLDEGDAIHFSIPVVSLAAGTDIDFMVTINTNSAATPKYWLFEYWDGSQWRHDESRLCTAREDSNVKYSVYIEKLANTCYRTFITSFTLPNKVENDFVKMRLRAVGKINAKGGALVATPNAYIYFVTLMYKGCEIVAYPDAPAVKDNTKLLQFGNSITFYNGSAFKLKQICRAEGHQTDVHINLKGSNQFRHHLEELQYSQEMMEEGGYDKVILQDGSFYHAVYGYGDISVIDGRSTGTLTSQDIRDLTERIGKNIKKYSPNCDIILENPYSFSYKTLNNWLGFGNVTPPRDWTGTTDEWNALTGWHKMDWYQWLGARLIGQEVSEVNWISPLSKAFAMARDEYGYTSTYNYLLYKDNYHPNIYGSYLKACVHYLIMFGEPFGAHPADCDVPAEHAAKLREIAEKIVLGNDGSKRETFHVNH